MADRIPRLSAKSRALASLFDACGWRQSAPKRNPKPKRSGRKKQTTKSNRGYEVRFSVPVDRAPRLIALLKSAGFEPGKPYSKGHHLRIPLYGKAQVARFLKFIGQRPHVAS